ncbi:DUF262 domain-containing protein [Brachyspira intermedia]|uniref:DUF262 domain-containing protein n=1 Tax=Brachyspira intermedia TaxID=84377 RepID=UPI003005D139
MSDVEQIYILENEKNNDYLKKYSFYIPNYQRGYKWSKKNIEDLLNDINSIDNNNNNKKDHCLHNLTIIEINEEHPMYNLTVKSRDKINYEVVDGQQRLTTIYLLLKYLEIKEEETYNLYYQIREKTKDFIDSKLKEVIINIKNNHYEIEKIFSDLVKYNNNYNKQDIYFICNALYCMHQWFTNNTDNKIYDKLKNVYFYKHELTGIKGETVFANLNSGRVPLTDIELIKADLIINISEEKNKSLNNDILLNEIRINIGRLWDEMESFLAQDEVWYWIAANNKSANKLSLLFDLINIKTFKDYKDILENKENNKTSNDILNKIKDYYYTIKDWYYDNDMYHLVGIAVNIGKSIKDLLPEKTDDGKYKLKNKKELKNKIIQSIIDNLSLKIDDNDSLKIGETQYEYLNYQNNSKDIEKIMLLLNCFEGYNFNKETKTFNEGFRYRFDLHNKEKWSIEHIFPQKIKNSGDKEKYKKYIKSYLIDLISYLLLDKESNQSQENLEMVLNTLNNEINYKNEIDSIINDINNSNKEYKIDDIINKIKTVIENNNFNNIDDINQVINNIGFIQQIGNLALLPTKANSSLQNDIFEEKRDKLLEKLSNENIFVPPLTLKIFSKNFDGSERTKEYWTPTDFDVYINYQEAQLKKILNLLK